MTELLTIYLSIGAPFGVASFLMEKGSLHYTNSLTRAISIMLLWPFTAFNLLLTYLKSIQIKPVDGETYLSLLTETQAKLKESLSKIEEFDNNSDNQSSIQNLYLKMEDYIEISISYKEESGRVQPASQHIDLYRIAGRKGEDLTTASLCMKRRNISRLKRRLQQSQDELSKALDTFNKDVWLHHARECSDRTVIYRFNLVVVQLYGQIANIFLILNDKEMAQRIERLLETEMEKKR
jgi:hypothetical protein